MGLKKMIVGAALTLAASGATLSVTAAPASAEGLPILVLQNWELMWVCAENDGEYFEVGAYAVCYLPNGKSILCKEGWCIIRGVQAPPTTPTPPSQQRSSITPTDPPVLGHP